MKQFITSIAMVGAGIAVGVLATKSYFKKKYRESADAEIREAREAFEKLADEIQTEEYRQVTREVVEAREARLERERKRKEYQDRVQNYGYTSATPTADGTQGIIMTKEEEPDDESLEPYEIPYDEFGMLDDYETDTLMYFADKTLAYDETGEVVYEIRDVIPPAVLDHIEEESSVYVRNPCTRTDYEVLLSLKTYDEVYGGAEL